VDTNKAVQTLALDIVCRISTGMGKPFEKHSRTFVLPICTVLSDQKAPIRMAALQALSSIATACGGVDHMVPGITSALEMPNPLQKGTLLNWLTEWFKEHEPSPGLEINSWIIPILGCLDDRNGDIRKGAQALLPTLIISAGFDYVLQQTSSLKPASRSSAIPLIQAARPAVAAIPSQPPASKHPRQAADIGSTATLSPPAPQSLSLPVKAEIKPTGVRRKLPQGTRSESRSETPVDRPSSRLKAVVSGSNRPGGEETLSAPRFSTSLPFYSVNTEAKKVRCGKDVQKWINDGGPTRKDLADLLQNQMESCASKDLVARLFSHDHNAVNDHIHGLTMMSDFYSAAPQDVEDDVAKVCIANLDLPLKYASLKAHEPQPNLISKCLDVVEAVLAFLRNANYQLTEGEALCFIPTMVFKVT